MCQRLQQTTNWRSGVRHQRGEKYPVSSANLYMGNISHSFVICTTSTKQERTTSSSACVFPFSLVNTPHCALPLSPPQKTATCRICGIWAFDRVEPAYELEGPRRNNPTIQDQACNSRGRDMCSKPAGGKRVGLNSHKVENLLKNWGQVHSQTERGCSLL